MLGNSTIYSFFLVLGRMTVRVSDVQRLSKLIRGERLVLARSSDQAFCAAKMHERGSIGHHVFHIGERNYDVIVADELELSPSEVERQIYSAETLYIQWTSGFTSSKSQAAPNSQS